MSWLSKYLHASKFSFIIDSVEEATKSSNFGVIMGYAENEVKKVVLTTLSDDEKRARAEAALSAILSRSGIPVSPAVVHALVSIALAKFTGNGQK